MAVEGDTARSFGLGEILAAQHLLGEAADLGRVVGRAFQGLRPRPEDYRAFKSGASRLADATPDRRDGVARQVNRVHAVARAESAVLAGPPEGDDAGWALASYMPSSWLERLDRESEATRDTTSLLLREEGWDAIRGLRGFERVIARARGTPEGSADVQPDQRNEARVVRLLDKANDILRAMGSVLRAVLVQPPPADPPANSPSQTSKGNLHLARALVERSQPPIARGETRQGMDRDDPAIPPLLRRLVFVPG